MPSQRYDMHKIRIKTENKSFRHVLWQMYILLCVCKSILLCVLFFVFWFLIYVLLSNVNFRSVFDNKTFFFLFWLLSYAHKFSIKWCPKKEEKEENQEEGEKNNFMKMWNTFIVLESRNDDARRFTVEMLPKYDALDMIKLKCWRWQWWWWLWWCRQPQWVSEQACHKCR